MAPECRQVEPSFLHAYVDGEFSAEESAEVKVHIEQCSQCAGEVARHRSYKAAVLRASIHAPHAFDHVLRDAIAEESRQGRWARAFRDPRGIAAAAAAVGAAMGFLAGGLSHPVFGGRGGHSLLDDGVGVAARALRRRYVA